MSLAALLPYLTAAIMLPIGLLPQERPTLRTRQRKVNCLSLLRNRALHAAQGGRRPAEISLRAAYSNRALVADLQMLPRRAPRHKAHRTGSDNLSKPPDIRPRLPWAASSREASPRAFRERAHIARLRGQTPRNRRLRANRRRLLRTFPPQPPTIPQLRAARRFSPEPDCRVLSGVPLAPS